MQASILAAGNSGDPKLGRAIRGHSLLNSQNQSLWRISDGKRQTRFLSGGRREPELWVWTLRSPACSLRHCQRGAAAWQGPGSCPPPGLLLTLPLLSVRYGISPDSIILYGQSIGTVPTVDLASRYECAAVVLHSPLTSGMRVAFPDTKKTYCFDAFPK